MAYLTKVELCVKHYDLIRNYATTEEEWPELDRLYAIATLEFDEATMYEDEWKLLRLRAANAILAYNGTKRKDTSGIVFTPVGVYEDLR